VLPVLAGGLKRGVWCVQEWTEQYRTAPTARPVPRLSPISGIANPLYRLDRACSLAGRRVADQCLPRTLDFTSTRDRVAHSERLDFTSEKFGLYQRA
jgi:hypothetical protein